MAGTNSTFTLILLSTCNYVALAHAEERTDNAAPARSPASNEDAQTMRTIRVLDDEEHAGGPVVGYVANRSAAASKTDTPLLETPQSISVITRDRLDDQGAQTLQDALRYSAGVRADAFGYDNRGDWAYIRGTSFVQYQDGLKALFGNYNNTRPDPYTLERVEVVRGPASVLYGQGGFGGLVNVVSKRPQAQTQADITAEIGSHNRRQMSADFTGALDRDATLLYRFIALGRESDTQVDHVPDDRKLIAPAVTWLRGDNTRLTVYANFQEDVSGSSVGFFPWAGTLYDVSHGRIPTDTFISEPGYDEYRARQKAFGYELAHRFSDVWELRQNVRHNDSDVNYKSLYSRFPLPHLNADHRSINRTLSHQHNLAESWTADTQLQASWQSGAFDHVFLAGADYQQATLGGERGSGDAPAIDVYAPVYGNFTPVAITSISDTTQRQTGLYAQLQSKFEQRWLAVIGARQDWAKSDTVNTPASKLDTDEHTIRLGLGYLAPQGWMPYVSYSESFVPIGGVNLFGQPYRPQTSQQLEGGIKYQPVDSASMYTAAVYEIVESGRRTADPNNPGNNVQVGAARVRGVELEALVEITRSLDIVASYAWTDSEVTRDNSPQLGKRLASVPEHAASVWARQRYAIGQLDGFTSGVGLRYVGDSWDGLDTVRTPGVTLLDAMLGYDTGHWRVFLNATNLTDKVHVTTCLSRGDCFYGYRRNVSARLSYRF
jgi:iron complex outermembrane recepter protein